MGAIQDKFDSVYRDFTTDGVASSGAHNPDKAEQRAIGTLIEQGISNASLGALVDVIFATKAELDADLAHDADSVALVYSDAADANNDLYVKSGANGAGAWNNSGALHSAIDARIDPIVADLEQQVALFRLRNIAYDGALTDGGAGVIWTGARSPAIAAAHADLQAYGIVNSVQIGTGGAGALFKLDKLEAKCHGKVVMLALRVKSQLTSETDADWPDTELARTIYQSPNGGGATTGGSIILANAFVQESASVRLYYMAVQMPATGTLGSIAYGFDQSATGSIAEMGGFIQTISDAEPTPANIPDADWTGFTARDSWRTGVDSKLVTAGIGPYANASVNPILAEDGEPVQFSSDVIFADAPAELAARGIERVVDLDQGNGAVNSFKKEPLAADAGGTYRDCEAYLYKSDGDWTTVAPPVFVATPYRNGGNTSANLQSAISGFSQITPQLRRYFKQGLVNAAYADYDHIRIGFASVGAAYVQGGFEVIKADALIDRLSRIPDFWFAESPTAAAIAGLRKSVKQTGGTLTGRSFLMVGDSKVAEFWKPEFMAEFTGAIVYNGGYSGCCVARKANPSDDQVYKNELSGLAIAEAIDSGDWSTMIQAADDYFAFDGTDYRARVAMMAALDYDALDGVIWDFSTNDPQVGIPLGEAGSLLDTEFYGALDQLIAHAKSGLPNTPFSLTTSGYRHDFEPGGVAGDNDALQEPYRAAMLERCAAADVPCLDMRKRGGIGPHNQATMLANDKIHLRLAGAAYEGAAQARQTFRVLV